MTWPKTYSAGCLSGSSSQLLFNDGQMIWVDVLRKPYLAQNGASNAMMVR